MPLPEAVFVVFGFDDGQGDVVVDEHVVGKGLFAAFGLAVGFDVETAVGEVMLLFDLRRLPAGVLDRRCDVLGADFLFGEFFFVHKELFFIVGRQ